ncbi:MAG: low specificity L-threonine aldolase, partial [Alphaproteobacteria bacterium]
SARHLAEGMEGVSGIEVWPVETNLVFFDLKKTGITAQIFHEQLLKRGVRIGIKSKFEMRAVTHLDVSMDQVNRAVDAVADVVARA